MKSVKHPIVQADDQFNRKIKHGSLELYIDPSWRPEYNRRQWGIIVSDFKDLKKGEKVYFHYLSLDPHPQLPPDKWLVHYKMLYCVIRDDKPVMLNDYLLVNIKDEQELKSDLIITLKQRITTEGTVRATNHPELEEGDTVLFNPINAFENEIDGVEYYVMESIDILAKVNERDVSSIPVASRK